MTTTLEHPPVQQQLPAHATGVLDIAQGGQGYLRTGNCLPTPNDLQVPAALIRRHGLRKGDVVEGVRGGQRGLTEVASVNGRAPEQLRGRPHFRDLTPLHPRERIRLEHPRAGCPPG
ncbi:hypothetical protein SAV31267_084050 [Streptomyces avermitilis]|uniref:Rho RNA-BD domain-containing protein n=1 Tax=Streptomyces avermitilis TaxID=33903 RepID=A0A4D4N366_STRAX|nr:hypothetical protein SAVMC3_15870 [Streptomyces avermitilis]GDY78920.1 hypothetical protein SAV31267_084050 [Streptomyces avermitilis]